MCDVGKHLNMVSATSTRTIETHAAHKGCSPAASPVLQVVDRLLLSQVLQGLDDIQLSPGVTVRAPKFLQVQDFAAAALADQLAAAGGCVWGR